MSALDKIDKFIVESLEKDSGYWIGKRYGFDINEDKSYFEIEDAGIYFDDQAYVCELSGTGYLHLNTALNNSDYLKDIGQESFNLYEEFEKGSVSANKKIDELWKKIEEAMSDISGEVEEWAYDTLDMIDYNDTPIDQYEVSFEINDSSVSTVSMEALINLVAPGARYFNSIGDVKPVLVGFDKDTFIEYIY